MVTQQKVYAFQIQVLLHTLPVERDILSGAFSNTLSPPLYLTLMPNPETGGGHLRERETSSSSLTQYPLIPDRIMEEGGLILNRPSIKRRGVVNMTSMGGDRPDTSNPTPPMPACPSASSPPSSYIRNSLRVKATWSPVVLQRQTHLFGLQPMNAWAKINLFTSEVQRDSVLSFGEVFCFPSLGSSLSPPRPPPPGSLVDLSQSFSFSLSYFTRLL